MVSYTHDSMNIKKTNSWWVQVVHTYNPSYSGGRDQEDHCSKPAWANSLQDSVLTKPFTKKGWWNGSKCRP
jgi:hypothetical protein